MPSLPNVDSFLRALDALVNNAPHGPAMPVVVVTGPAESDTPGLFVMGLEDRFVDNAGESALLPHVLLSEVPPGEEGTESRSIEKLADGLHAAMPTGTGSLRFRSLTLCRDILEATPTATEPRERRAKLLDHLYGQHSLRQRWARPFAQLDAAQATASAGAIGPVLQMLWPILRFVPQWWFGQRLAHGRRLRWLTKRLQTTYGTPSPDFLTNALQLTADKHPDPAVVEPILMSALLHDLEAALRRPWLRQLSVRRRRRRWPFVVLLRCTTDPASPLRSLLNTYADVVREDRTSPLLVVASVPGERPAFARDLPALDLATAAQTLIEDRRSRTRACVLDLGSTAADDPVARHWLLNNSKVPFRPNRLLDYASPALSLLCVSSLVVAGLLYLAPRHEACDDTWTNKAGERVGVTDGTCLLADDPGPDAGDQSDDYKALKEVEGAIARQNTQVLEKYRSRHLVYRTVVFFSPVTKPRLPGREGEVFLQQLQGVALAQQEANSGAAYNENQVRLRLLIANPGDRYADAEGVARKIVELAEADRSLVAVVGVSQSRKETQAAIGVLTRDQLTVVASEITADNISRSQYFYQVAPPNDRLAAAAASFARHEPSVLTATGKRVKAGRAVVIEDPGDVYSQNLAEDFRHHFAAEGGKVVATFSYQPRLDPTLQIQDPRLGNQDRTISTADDLARGVCQTIDTEKDLVFYSQRAYDLPAFLDAVEKSTECRGRRITLLSGDDGGGFVASRARLQYKFVQFYYLAFNAPGEQNGVGQRFSAEFRSRFGPTPDDGLPMLAFDSFLVAKEAIDEAYRDRNPDFERSVVHVSLAHGEIDFTGASGSLVFNREQRAPKDKPVFVLEATRQQAGPSLVRLKCGRFANGKAVLFWGSGPTQYACPTD